MPVISKEKAKREYQRLSGGHNLTGSRVNRKAQMESQNYPTGTDVTFFRVNSPRAAQDLRKHLKDGYRLKVKSFSGCALVALFKYPSTREDAKTIRSRIQNKWK